MLIKKGNWIKVEIVIGANNIGLRKLTEEKYCILKFNYFESENYPIKKITLRERDVFFSEVYNLILKNKEDILDDLL